jgi:two-component system response regulator
VSPIAEAPVDILLVEDNPDDEELMLHSLRSMATPVEVAVAHDGVEALACLRAPAGGARVVPRVILLDIKLPRVDGFEVLAELKTDALLRHIPVVLFTSAGQEGELVRGYKLGANSYVVKPVDFERFAEMVRQLCTYWLGVNRGPEPTCP